MKITSYTILLLGIIIISSSCSLISYFHLSENSNNKPRQIIIYDDYLKIEWDIPALLQKKQEVAQQNIYIRELGENSWKLVKTIEGGNISHCTITNGELTSGRYSIGVSITTTEGLTSEIHASTDQTAVPSTGWYVFWIID